MVFNTIPALVCAADRIRFSHEIGTFFIFDSVTAEILLSARNCSSPLKWNMPSKRVLNILSGGGTDSLVVGILDSGNGRVHLVSVAAGKSGVIRTTMMVCPADGVESIDSVGNRQLLSSQMRCAISCASLFSEDLEWSVRHVAWVSLDKRGLARDVTIAGAEATVVHRRRSKA